MRHIDLYLNMSGGLLDDYVQPDSPPPRAKRPRNYRNFNEIGDGIVARPRSHEAECADELAALQREHPGARYPDATERWTPPKRAPRLVFRAPIDPPEPEVCVVRKTRTWGSGVNEITLPRIRSLEAA